ncbi:MAG TPA: 16S rRNA (uracil(1498)-N(3))-methyltransferase [Vicinamibacteria bacterium]|nr:16S rRNA (uracil(1498)-N(3))-methyltransferase [Vicinamibacteria bacterium]
MSVPRFHVPTAAPGARVDLPEHSAHHAREVLRLRAGAPVRVFDGEGAEFGAVLDEVSRRTVSARLGHTVRPRAESALHLVLAVSALKGDRMDVVVQKATELGVAEIWPVVTFRTDAAARPALQGSRSERWERVASGAAEQCGRAVVPRVAPTTTLDGLLARPFDGVRVGLFETAGHPALASLAVDPSSALLVLVGPAGGFEPAEAEGLRSAGFLAASLGPRILRAETAAVAAVAIAQAVWGDLRS